MQIKVRIKVKQTNKKMIDLVRSLTFFQACGKTGKRIAGL